jgi:hypothetical protein
MPADSSLERVEASFADHFPFAFSPTQLQGARWGEAMGLAARMKLILQSRRCRSEEQGKG